MFIPIFLEAVSKPSGSGFFLETSSYVIIVANILLRLNWDNKLFVNFLDFNVTIPRIYPWESKKYNRDIAPGYNIGFLSVI